MASILINWFWDVLSFLGLSRKHASIVFLGLDNAGKTTLLQVLKHDRVAQNIPTLHPHSEELIVGKICFKAYDLGGHETARRIWTDYLAATDAIVFIVDASDRDRFDEANVELNQLLKLEDVSSIPILVLGNKIDRPGAASEEEMRQRLGLFAQMTFGKNKKGKSEKRPVELFMCSVIKRRGYVEAFRWLSQFLS